MKKVKYLAMLLTAGMFAACSDNLEDTGAGNAGGTTPGTTEGYVRVAINMPTTSGNSSRSTDNGESGANVSLEDGEANEYNVENGIIVFFKAGTTASAEDAKFERAYSLTIGEPAEGPAPQVTTRYSTITEAPQVGENEQLYALVILNYDGTTVNFAAAPEEDNDKSGTLTIGGTKMDKTKTLSDFQTKLTANLSTFIGQSKNQFTMTNAPFTNAQGVAGFDASTAKAYTLVPVTVYPDEATAMEAPANQIYVERVVAKVTLAGFTYNSGATPTYTKKIKEGNDVIQLEYWALNVTNRSTKLVRDVNGYSSTGWLGTATSGTNEAKRFAGTAPVTAGFVDGTTNYYRIYWAEDANYEGTAYTPAEEFNIYSGSVEPAADVRSTGTIEDNSENNDGHPLYCLENTMTFLNQDQNETTGVLIKTIYLPQFAGQNAPTEQDFFICGANATKYPTNSISSGAKGFIEYVKEVSSYKDELYIKTSANGGIYNSAEEIKNLLTDQSSGEGTSTITNDEYTAIWNAVGRISYYKKGKSYYYATLIRHFQDSEGVAWSVNSPIYTLAHLGRYGVVRNNWYEITINSVSGPGDPEIPDTPDTPDDEIEGYINCTINVLSWAKRSQNVDL